MIRKQDTEDRIQAPWTPWVGH